MSKKRKGLAGDWDHYNGKGMIETRSLADFFADVWSEKVQLAVGASLEELVEAAIHYGCFAPGVNVDVATEAVLRALDDEDSRS